MSDDDITPERLDAILNGSEPAADDADRDMLALAGALRGAAPPASDELRERVRATAAQAPADGRSGRAHPGWRTRALIAGPALATLAAAIVVIAVVGGDGKSRPANLASSESTATAPAAAGGAADSASQAPTDALKVAPTARASADAGPVIMRVGTNTLERRVADARRIVTDAGGTVLATPQATPRPGTLLTITLPADQAADALAKLAALGTVTGGALDPAADGPLRLLMTERS